MLINTASSFSWIPLSNWSNSHTLTRITPAYSSFVFSTTRDSESISFGTQSGTKYGSVDGVKCSDYVSTEFGSVVNQVNFSKC